MLVLGWRQEEGCGGENFTIESNRDEDKVEREKTGMRNMKRMVHGDIRHNQRLHSMVLRESHLVPQDKPKANKAESW